MLTFFTLVSVITVSRSSGPDRPRQGPNAHGTVWLRGGPRRGDAAIVGGPMAALHRLPLRPCPAVGCVVGGTSSGTSTCWRSCGLPARPSGVERDGDCTWLETTAGPRLGCISRARRARCRQAGPRRMTPSRPEESRWSSALTGPIPPAVRRRPGGRDERRTCRAHVGSGRTAMIRDVRAVSVDMAGPLTDGRACARPARRDRT